jgi:hypothetical protein
VALKKGDIVRHSDWVCELHRNKVGVSPKAAVGVVYLVQNQHVYVQWLNSGSPYASLNTRTLTDSFLEGDDNGMNRLMKIGEVRDAEEG